MGRMDIGRLTEFAAGALERSGMPAEDAATVATILVRTSARGSTTHGVGRLGLYVSWIEAGSVNPHAKVRCSHDGGAVCALDGDRGLGHLVADKATRTAVARAREYGIAAVAVRHSSHLGALGHYALTAAEAGLAALAWTNTPQVMQAPGGRGRLIGNGPMAYGFPRQPVPIVFDSAMSVVSGSRVGMAAERGAAVPLGWLVDSQGTPTTDATSYRQGGALVGIGEHKGFGLALMSELLAGVMTGAAMLSEVPQFAAGMSTAPNIGHFFVMVRPDAFIPPSQLADRVERFAAELKSAPGIASHETLRLPGERSHDREERAQTDGLEIEAADLAGLVRLADRLDCAPLLAAARR